MYFSPCVADQPGRVIPDGSPGSGAVVFFFQNDQIRKNPMFRNRIYSVAESGAASKGTPRK
jgi:hypothetical protein